MPLPDFGYWRNMYWGDEKCTERTREKLREDVILENGYNNNNNPKRVHRGLVLGKLPLTHSVGRIVSAVVYSIGRHSEPSQHPHEPPALVTV